MLLVLFAATGLCVVRAVRLCSFLVWSIKAKRCLKMGESLYYGKKDRKYIPYHILWFVGITVLYSIIMLLENKIKLLWIVMILEVMVFLFFALISKRRPERSKNRNYQIAFSFVLLLVIWIAVLVFDVDNTIITSHDHLQSPKSYPLVIEDFDETDKELLASDIHTQKSILVHEKFYRLLYGERGFGSDFYFQYKIYESPSNALLKKIVEKEVKNVEVLGKYSLR